MRIYERKYYDVVERVLAFGRAMLDEAHGEGIAEGITGGRMVMRDFMGMSRRSRLI